MSRNFVEMQVSESSTKVVLVTGASSGIGSALSLEFARRGWSVGLLARRKELLEDIALEVEKAGGKALCLPADVTDINSLKSAVSQVYTTWGHIDTLIANAGVGATSHATAINVPEFARVVNINLIGAVNSVAAVLDGMLSRNQGQIVAISSLAAYRGLPKSGAYCASKAGLSAFAESLRIDLRNSGIDVTLIHPGFIKTPLTAGRHANMPFLMELPDAASKMMKAIEKRRRSYSFPWQLAAIVKLGLVMPAALYDRISARNSFRE
jgi:short-subunit dehydrogenase